MRNFWLAGVFLTCLLVVNPAFALERNDNLQMPTWIQQVIDLYNDKKITLLELNNAINFVQDKIEPEQSLEETILRIFDFQTSIFDGGQPIVFSGKLTTNDGIRIPNAEILIKSDGPCPENGIIANGATDKYGKFWIYIMPKIWDPVDNIIRIHAEFLGTEKYSPSISQPELIAILSSHAQNC